MRILRTGLYLECVFSNYACYVSVAVRHWTIFLSLMLSLACPSLMYSSFSPIMPCCLIELVSLILPHYLVKNNLMVKIQSDL